MKVTDSTNHSPCRNEMSRMYSRLAAMIQISTCTVYMYTVAQNNIVNIKIQ